MRNVVVFAIGFLAVIGAFAVGNIVASRDIPKCPYEDSCGYPEYIRDQNGHGYWYIDGVRVTK